VAYLRALEGQGLRPVDALPLVRIALAADTDQLLTTAKLRAARRILARIAESCGAAASAGRVRLHAITSQRMMTRRDPWVNLLRTTTACASAAFGGAADITVLPFTWVLGETDAFARRIARNVQIVLQEESSLGRVADPGAGSAAIEKLTDDLAAKGWAIFQDLEAHAGIGRSLASGRLQDQIGATAEARARSIAAGKMELTGTSAFPMLGADGVTARPHPATPAVTSERRVRPLTPRRLAEPFERLRDAADAYEKRSGKPPQVFLASLGTVAEHSARSTWIKNFLAAGGIEAIVSDGYSSSADAGASFAASGAKLACICSSDAVYAELAESTAGVLKQAGASRVYLAGRPKDEAALRAAGVDAFIFAGADMLATLAGLHEQLGV
jgi:methylmalonyl-CoA mutase